MRKYLKLRFFTILFLYCLFINISSSYSTTLEEALEMAYKNSEYVYMQMKQKDIASIERDATIGNFLPQLEASYLKGKLVDVDTKFGSDLTKMLAGMQSEQNDNGNNADRPKTMDAITFQATLPMSYYKTIPAMITAQKMVGAKEYEFNDFLENFGLLFIQQYMDIIYYSKSKEVYEKMSETLDKKLKRVNIMNKYGTAKRDKVVMAEAQYYENKAKEINTKSALDKASLDYKIMTGQMPDNLEVPDLMNATLPAKSKEEFVALVLQKNNKLLKAQYELSTQKFSLLTQSVSLLPDVFAMYSYTNYKVPNYMKYSYGTIGLGVSWKFGGKQFLLSDQRKSYKSYKIAELNYNLTKKQIEQDAMYYWEQYFASVELVKATEKALRASKDSLTEIKVSLSMGTATFIDEMDIENQYLNANLNFLNAQKSLTIAYYKMISLTGIGKLTSISKNN